MYKHCFKILIIINIFFSINYIFCKNLKSFDHRPKYNYEVIYYLSISSCPQCYFDKIKKLNSFFQSDDSSQSITYIYIEELDNNEKLFLKNKLNSINIYSLSDSVFTEYLSSVQPQTLLIISSSGVLCYKNSIGNIIINDFNQSINNFENLKFVNKKKLLLDNMPIFSISKLKIDKSNNMLYLLDNLANQISVINLSNFQLESIIKPNGYIDSFFVHKDNSSDHWKWKYNEPAKIKSYILDPANKKLLIIFKLYDILLEKEINNNDTLITVVQSPRILTSEYENNKFTDIKIFPYREYSLNYSNIIKCGNSIFTSGKGIQYAENLSDISSGSDKSFLFYKFAETLKLEDAMIQSSRIISTINQNYNSKFDLDVKTDNCNYFLFVSFLNATIFSYDFAEKSINKFDAFGLLKMSLNKIKQLKLTPEFILMNRDKKLDIEYFIKDIIISKSKIFFLINNYDNENKIIKLILQMYNFKGEIIKEYEIHHDVNNDCLLDSYFLDIFQNRIQFLNKWKKDGWLIQDLILN